MKVNAARDITAEAWGRWTGTPVVQIRLGVIRLSASPEEALAFAAELTEAAKMATARAEQVMAERRGGGND